MAYTIYVSNTYGLDTYDGTRKRHGTGNVGPVKTIFKALSLVTDALGGWRIEIAPGTYDETSECVTPYKGTAANVNVIHGDTTCTLTDPAGQTFQETPGQVFILANVGTWKQAIRVSLDYWKLKNLTFSTTFYGSGVDAFPFMFYALAGAHPIGCEAEDCTAWGTGYGTFFAGGTQVAPHKFTRCILNASHPAQGIGSNEVAPVSTSTFILDTCVFNSIGSNSNTSPKGLFYIDDNTPYSKVAVNECTFFGYNGSVSSGDRYAMGSQGTRTTFEATNCLLHTQNINSGSSRGTDTGNYNVGNVQTLTGFTDQAVMSFVPTVGLLKGSALVGSIADFHASLSGDNLYDIYGYSRATSATTPGPIETATIGYAGYGGASSPSPLLGFVPDIPTGVAASDGTSASKVTVSWNASAGSTSYSIYRSTTTTPPGSATFTGVTSPYDDTTVTVDVVYYYWVSGVNTYGGSSLSAYDTGYSHATGGVGMMDRTMDAAMDSGMDVTI